MSMIPASEIRVGSVVLPPKREVDLWMRRWTRERGLTDAALHLTVVEVREAAPDKNGRWLVFRCDHTPEWLRGRAPFQFTFKARPDTKWVTLQKGG